MLDGLPNRIVVWAALATAVTATTAAPAAAQDIPYHNYLVGDRALGLGGAFVGLADDAAATFHNPAGLAVLPDTSISASFWVVAFNHRKVEQGWVSPQGSSDLRDNEFTSPPLVVTAVAKIGKSDPLGRKRHAIGLALLKPLRLRYRYTVAAQRGDPSALSTFDVIHSDQARWYGVSYSYDTRCGVSYGVTGFLSFRSLRHEEIEIHAVNGPPTPSPDALDVTRHSNFHASLTHVVWRLGVLWTPSPSLRLGAMAQLPGWALSGDASNREVTVDLVDDNGTTSQVERIEHRFLTASRPIPLELRFGGTWYPNARSLITADITVHGPAGSRDAPVQLIDSTGVPQPRFLAMETYLGPSIRAAIGGETFATDRIPVRGGLMAYRSGLPDVPRESDRFTASDLNTVGASFSVGWILSGGHELSFGAAGTYAWGTGSALDQTDLDTATYLSTPVTETTVLVFMSGGKRAFKRLARRLYNEGQKLIRRGQGWLDEE